MKIHASAGPFAGDKDVAAYIRDSYLRPTIAKGRVALLDFVDVQLTTQSFIHALLASVVREDPARLDSIDFVGCNEDVQAIIEIVVEYAQDQFE